MSVVARVAQVEGFRDREVYRVLGGRPGMMQRSVKHPDLLIAAAAERAGLTLVHYDADYETIAENHRTVRALGRAPRIPLSERRLGPKPRRVATGCAAC